MLKLATMAAAAAFLGTAALAAEATGHVSQVDPSNGTLTLEDGMVFVLPPNFNEPSVSEANTVVVITYETVDGKNVASDIRIEHMPEHTPQKKP